MAFAILNRFFGRDDARDAWRGLYAAVVERAREPAWYEHGAVPDTIDGRFEMVMLISSIISLRLEALGAVGCDAMARLTEVLVEDLEGQIREIGFGDVVVGKQMGRMMSAFGGRLGAYREALSGGNLETALVRNLYRGVEPLPEALGFVADRVRMMFAAVGQKSLEELQKADMS
jgi:cytochrome b pre-mRNA-processing protein 3